MQYMNLFPQLRVRETSFTQPVKMKRKKMSEKDRSDSLVEANTSKKKHLTDDQILEIRVMKEIHGMSTQEIMKKFDISYARAYAVLSYHYRDHIVPIGGTPTFMHS